MTSQTVKDMFPDWETIEPGNWSVNGCALHYGEAEDSGREIYIGLYREPLDGDEYAGTYTLEILDGDEVIFCQKVE